MDLLFLLQLGQRHLLEATSAASGEEADAVPAVSAATRLLWPVSLLKLGRPGWRWAELLKKHPEFTLEVGVAFEQRFHLRLELKEQQEAHWVSGCHW